MSHETLAQIGFGKITGTVVGVVGLAVGTYIAFKTTAGRGPRERAFMIRACITFWLGACLYIAGMSSLPKPHKYILLPIGIVASIFGGRYVTRRQLLIRAEESKDSDDNAA